MKSVGEQKFQNFSMYHFTISTRTSVSGLFKASLLAAIDGITGLSSRVTGGWE